MLKVIEEYGEIDFRQLMDVYAQWNQENGERLYPKLDASVQQLYSEQDFYTFLLSYFEAPGAVYCVWALEDRYVAALRIEPYQDGVLLEGLETLPQERRKGAAFQLMNATIDYLKGTAYDVIYSHVEKDNLPSLALHNKCGFRVHAEDAIYIDGTHHKNSYTLIYKNNPTV